MRTMAIIGALFTSGCATIGATPSTSPAGLPPTPGEVASSYGYVPLDPLAIYEEKAPDGSICKAVPLLEALPDIAVRFAVAEIDGSGGLNFGPSKTTIKNKTYRAVLDYVNVDAVPADFIIRKRIGDSSPPIWVTVSTPVPDDIKVTAYQAEYYDRERPLRKLSEEEERSFERVTIPIYVGVGLRLSADIRALSGDITLSGLGAIGAQAEAKNLSGTLTVQTLGVTGKSIAVALPLPSKLDQTTIESGILAIGGSRAILYTAEATGDKVTAMPRIVGLYSPVGSDPRLINAVYSELSRAQPAWRHPCKVKEPTVLVIPPAEATPAAKKPAAKKSKKKT